MSRTPVLSVIDDSAAMLGQLHANASANDLMQARAAVAELIDCAAAMNALAKGPTGGVTQAQKRSIVDRMDAALSAMGSQA